MAENNNKQPWEQHKSKMDWMNTFVRTGKFPLDRSSLFETLADAEAYAKGDGSDVRGLGGSSYIGQIITVIGQSNEQVKTYKINKQHQLEEFGIGGGSASSDEIKRIENLLNEEINRAKTAEKSAKTKIAKGASSSDRLKIEKNSPKIGEPDIYTISLTDAIYDNNFNLKSINAVQNKIITEKINSIDNIITDIDKKIDKNKITISTGTTNLVKVEKTPNTDISENGFSYKISGDGIASNNNLTAETKNRKTVTGVDGDSCTYSETNYLNGETSLHAADVKLDLELKNIRDEIKDIVKSTGDTKTVEVVVPKSENYLKCDPSIDGSKYTLTSKNIAEDFKSVNDKIGTSGDSGTDSIYSKINDMSGTVNSGLGFKYITSITQDKGKITSVVSKGFDSSLSDENAKNSENAPQTKVVFNLFKDTIGLITGLTTEQFGSEGSFIETVNQTKGKISASTKPFINEINASTSGSTIAPQTTAIVSYVNTFSVKEAPKQTQIKVNRLNNEFTISPNGLANQSDLNKEIEARKIVTGVQGDTREKVKEAYASNELLKNSTSLIESDITLSTKIASNTASINEIKETLKGLDSGSGQIVIPTTTIELGNDNDNTNLKIESDTTAPKDEKKYKITLNKQLSTDIANLKSQYNDLDTKITSSSIKINGKNSGHITVEILSLSNGSKEVTINEDNDITSLIDFKAVTGTDGKKCVYSGTNYLNNIKSLKLADVELDKQIKNCLPLTGGTIDGDLQIGTGTTNVKITNGTIDAKGAIYSSDRNLKKDIALINNDAIESVKNIDLKSYKFKDDETNRERYGVIAQELEEANLNNLVVEDSNGKKGVDYVSFLILKIAQLEQEIKQLKNR